MGSPTVSFVIRPDKVKADGTAPIFLRASYGGRSRYASTGVRIAPKHWNGKKRRVKAACPLAALFNRRLDDLYSTALAASFEVGSAEQVIAALDGSSGTVSGYVERLMAGMDENGQYWDRRKYAVLLNKLHSAFGEPLGWASLSPEGLRKFERHLREQCRNGANTTRREMKRLSTICNHAVRDGVLKADRNPFQRYTLPKGEPVEKRRLSLEEIEVFAAVKLEDGSRRRIVRDSFLVALYCGGIRISDVLLLKPENVKGNRLHQRMQKTGGIHDIEIAPVALSILEPYMKAAEASGGYVFPLLPSGDDNDKEDVRRRQHRATSVYNIALKEAGELAGIGAEGLSSHCSRHSFADQARKQGDVYLVSKLLGHSSIAVTQKYLASLDLDAQDQLVRKMWRKAGG